MAEFTKDYNLFQNLRQVREMLSTLVEGVDDTLLLLGNEMMKQSDQCYGFLQTAAKGNPALSSVVDLIAAAFSRGPNAQGTPIGIPSNGTTVLRLDISKPVVNSGNTVLK